MKFRCKLHCRHCGRLVWPWQQCLWQLPDYIAHKDCYTTAKPTGEKA